MFFCKGLNHLIRIRKQAEPTVLRDKRKAWTKQLRMLRAAKADEKDARKKYRHATIVNALIKETNGKCCYCECLVESRQFEPVEHVIPWSVNATTAYKWSNLLLVCAPCNTAKGEYYNRAKPLIDPSKFDPSNHFRFVGEVIKDRSNSRFAPQSRVEIKLNRGGLIETRGKCLKELLVLYKDLASFGLSKNQIKQMKSFDRFLNRSAEYSACCKAYFSAL